MAANGPQVLALLPEIPSTWRWIVANMRPDSGQIGAGNLVGAQPSLSLQAEEESKILREGHAAGRTT